jgi:hypothetical protein
VEILFVFFFKKQKDCNEKLEIAPKKKESSSIKKRTV